MADFNTAYEITALNEGGYANNKADTGGETYKGVSRVFNPGWFGWAAVDAAKKQTKSPQILDKLLGQDAQVQRSVLAFYRLNYWDANKLGQIDSQEIASKLFDIGVNMGVGLASRILQEGLNLTNNNGRAYPDMAVDGIVGPTTLKYTNSHPRPQLLLQVLKALQSERYLNIMRHSPTQEVFAASWFSRV